MMKVALAQKFQKDWIGLDWIGMCWTLIDLKCLDPAGRGDSPGMTWQQQRAIFTHLSRCQYELGEYVAVSETGSDAKSIYRVFPDRHQELTQQSITRQWEKEQRAFTPHFFRERYRQNPHDHWLHLEWQGCSW